MFDNIDHLRSHILADHSKDLFPCMSDGCYSSFNTKKGLLCHEAAHNKKTHSCSPCSQEFDSANDLKEHNRSALHKDNVKRTPCKGCGKIFSGKSAANTHFNGFCPFNPDRRVKCQVCNCKTGKASKFLKHLHDVHVSTNKYFCTRCLGEFETEKQLKDHQKKCNKGG